MINLPEYLKSDISIALSSLLRLNYYPHAIFTELNQMSKLAIFKKDSSLRLLDTLVDYMQTRENSELSSQIVEKMLDQI